MSFVTGYVTAIKVPKRYNHNGIPLEIENCRPSSEHQLHWSTIMFSWIPLMRRNYVESSRTRLINMSQMGRFHVGCISWVSDCETFSLVAEQIRNKLPVMWAIFPKWNNWSYQKCTLTEFSIKDFYVTEFRIDIYPMNRCWVLSAMSTLIYSPYTHSHI